MAVDLYGATLEDVAGFLIWDPHRSTDPTPQQIETWLRVGASDLHGVVGDISVDGPCGGDTWRIRARHLVALFAAAMAEDAHYPERASLDRESGNYGAVLWDRHEKRFGSLKADIEACRDGVDSGVRHGGVAACFPTPVIRRDMGT